MASTAHRPAPTAAAAPRADSWVSLADCIDRVPAGLRPWLAEPGLLTARVRAECGDTTMLRMLNLAPAALPARLRGLLGVGDERCLLRDVEIGCDCTRWIFARSVFPDSTVERHPWLRDLGDRGLGESLSRVSEVRREPLQYAELPVDDELALAACGGAAAPRPLWARRAIYRLAGFPILVQEIFLPGLGGCCEAPRSTAS